MKTTIAINLGHKFVAIEAETIEVLQIPLALHKRPGHNTWNITDPRSGFALTTNKTSREAARFDVVNKIGTTGRDKVLALIAAAPAAPAVDTLEAYVAPVKVKTVPADIDSIVKLIGDRVDLNDGERLAVRNALNSRTGRLKAKAPSDDWSKAAWNGLQPNAWKIQFSACFLRGEPAELLSKLSKHTWPVALDKDLSTLRALGVA